MPTQRPDWEFFEGLGLRAFPSIGVTGDGTCRCSSGVGCSSPGKHPKYRGWWDSAGTAQAYGQWRDGDNMAVATGRGVAVLDWDGPPPSSRPRPSTLMTQTPSGGEHWFFKTNRTVRNGVKVFDGVLDIRGEGGFVVVPPSQHRNMRAYEWKLVAPLAFPPTWVLGYLRPQRPAKTDLPNWPTRDVEEESLFWEDLFDQIVDDLRDAGAGTRNMTLFKSACRVADMVCSGSLYMRRMTELADAAVQIGLTPDEVRRTIRSAIRTVAVVELPERQRTYGGSDE